MNRTIHNIAKSGGIVTGITTAHLPLSEGRQITRQYSLPGSLMDKRKWFDHTISIGMNSR